MPRRDPETLPLIEGKEENPKSEDELFKEVLELVSGAPIHIGIIVAARVQTFLLMQIPDAKIREKLQRDIASKALRVIKSMAKLPHPVAKGLAAQVFAEPQPPKKPKKKK